MLPITWTRSTALADAQPLAHNQSTDRLGSLAASLCAIGDVRSHNGLTETLAAKPTVSLI
jgi:hypothetical protein